MIRVTLAATLALASLASLAPAQPAGASRASAPRVRTAEGGPNDGNLLQVASISPWVDADGAFDIRFAPSSGVPEGAELTYSVFQRLEGSTAGLAQAVRDATADSPPSRLLQAPRTVPVESLGDPVQGLDLSIPLRSASGDSARVFVPEPGIHPVRLDLQSATGAGLWSALVFLNRLPEDEPKGSDGQPAVTSVQLVASIDSGPALDPLGTTSLGTDELAAIASLQQTLDELRTVPMTVALRPNTLEGLRLSAEPEDAAFLEAARTSAWVLPAQSYVRVDAAGLVRTGSAELERQLGVGEAINAATLGRGADPSMWILDDTVDQDAARALQSLGVSHLLMSPDRFVPEDRSIEDTSRVFAVDGVSAMAVSSFDGSLTRELLDGEDPAMAAHLVSTLLMAAWFEAVGESVSPFPGVVATILVPPGTPAESVASLAEPLGGDGPLQLRPFPAPATTARGPARARLAERDGADMTDVVERTELVGARIDGYRSMTSSGDAEAITWDLVNDQAVALFIDEAEREQIWNTVEGQIAQRVSLLEPPASRTIVLTSRSGSIPLRMRNGLQTTVRLRMEVRSSRLDFPAGEVVEVVLAPGENRIDLPVVVRAPGSSLLRIELSSPDGALRLPESRVTVRSSSISGVGAALSILSLAFLGFWWLRTHRRKRRSAD